VPRALLDVNVLIALFDPNHADHDRAHRWFAEDAGKGRASCPITENGFVRIMSQSRYPSSIAPAEAIQRLAGAQAMTDHDFWPCDVSVVSERIDGSRLHGPLQVTDAYLLALAAANDGRLATFDRSVPMSAVSDATERHLTVIS
jgi:uncharacterized protein